MDWTWIMAVCGLLLSLILGAFGNSYLSIIGRIVGYLLIFFGVAFYCTYKGYTGAYPTSMVFTGLIIVAESYCVKYLPWGEQETVITDIVGYIVGIILVIVGFCIL